MESIYKKVRSKKKIVGGLKSLLNCPRRRLMELPDIDFKRIQFLRRYVEIKQQNLYMRHGYSKMGP